MKVLNEQDFNSAISEKGISVVDFFADWCGPCKMLAPFFEQAANEYTDVHFYKVNVDDSQSLAAKFDIYSIPTIIFFKDGNKVLQTTGFKSFEQLKSLIEQVKTK